MKCRHCGSRNSLVYEETVQYQIDERGHCLRGSKSTTGDGVFLCTECFEESADLSQMKA